MNDLAKPKEITFEQVMAAIRRVKYGSITVKIHDGKVTEMEVTEKHRP